ncbi:hypothetical protein MBLNU457_g0374t1 [Dothideomycetes sp. NU457]
MNTSDGGNAGRRDSVSHGKHRRMDSSSCRSIHGAESIEGTTPSESIPVSNSLPQQTPLTTDASPPQSTFAYNLETAASSKPRTPSKKRLRSGSKLHKSSRSKGQNGSLSSPAKLPLEVAELSDMEIQEQLWQLLDQTPTHQDLDLVSSYMNASLQPPITHESLSELDISRIINNPKLRHDVNFDRELHFRPNLDGSRGRYKLKAADGYWKALIGELELYRACGAQIVTCDSAQSLAHWSRMMKDSQKRLPGMFETIRDIIKTLVPERDQVAVTERLDVGMIMQEISKGVFDLMSLAQWLARLLKAHCAPMRDEWIDQMVVATQKGVDEGCQKRIVLGLRQLFGILEAMKLDVANHQIRHLRGVLIEDAVAFQQRYHIHRLNYGRLDTVRARRWFDRESLQHSSSMSRPKDSLRIFTSALFRSLLAHSSMSSFPETFQLDAERLRTMRHDLQHLIGLDICCDVFDLLLSNPLSPEARESAHRSLKQSITDIVSEGLGSRRFMDSHANIAVEIARVVCSMDDHTSIDADLIELAEQRLRSDLPVSSLAFTARAKTLLANYADKFYAVVKDKSRLSPTALHEFMVPPPSAPAAIAGLLPSEPKPKSLDDVFRRMTHVAVLHWHIWSPLAYCVEQGGELSVQRLAEPSLSPMPESCGDASGSEESETGSECSDDACTPEPDVDMDVDMDGKIELVVEPEIEAGEEEEL